MTSSRSWSGRGSTPRAARVRSLPPYDLRITVRLTRRDPAARVPAVETAGDPEGWTRRRLVPRGGADGGADGGAGVPEGTRAVFEQEVEARKPLLRLPALPCRPLFTADHALMMRAGRRGLRRRLGTGRREERGGPGKEFG